MFGRERKLATDGFRGLSSSRRRPSAHPGGVTSSALSALRNMYGNLTGKALRLWPAPHQRQRPAIVSPPYEGIEALMSPQPSVNLLFKGEILPGFHVDDVKRDIGDFFKLDEPKRERMFLGAPYVVKRAVAPQDAARYVALFARFGGRLHTEMTSAQPPAPVSPPTPTAAMSPPAPGGARPLALTPIDAQPVPPPAPPARIIPGGAPIERRYRDDVDDPVAVSPEIVVVHEPASVFGIGLEGRLARRPYGAGVLFGWAAIRWGLVGIAHHPSSGVIALIGLGVLLATLFTARLTVLRLHDLNLPAWWGLILLVPLLGLLASLGLSLVPGSNGDNRYGSEPDPGSRLLRLVVLFAVVVIGGMLRHSLMMGDGLVGHPLRNPNTIARQASPDETAHSIPTDAELSGIIKSGAARQVYKDAYWPAKTHKAFAVSDGGAYAWSGEDATVAAARSQALEKCEQARDAYSAACEIVDVDGEWADQ